MINSTTNNNEDEMIMIIHIQIKQTVIDHEIKILYSDKNNYSKGKRTRWGS